MNSRKPDAVHDPLGALIHASLSEFVAHARPSPYLRSRLLLSARAVSLSPRLSARQPARTRWNWLVGSTRRATSLDWVALLNLATMRTVEINLPLLRLVS